MIALSGRVSARPSQAMRCTGSVARPSQSPFTARRCLARGGVCTDTPACSTLVSMAKANLPSATEAAAAAGLVATAPDQHPPGWQTQSPLDTPRSHRQVVRQRASAFRGAGLRHVHRVVSAPFASGMTTSRALGIGGVARPAQLVPARFPALPMRKRATSIPMGRCGHRTRPECPKS